MYDLIEQTTEHVYENTCCWRWKGRHRKEDGRPVLRKRYVYRLVYEDLHGPIPRGCGLHHRCDRPWCVNPAHVEPMRQRDHLRLHGLPGDWGQADKTHCPSGHTYSPENTYRWRGERHCRACRVAAKRRYNAKQSG